MSVVGGKEKASGAGNGGQKVGRKCAGWREEGRRRVGPVELSSARSRPPVSPHGTT